MPVLYGNGGYATGGANKPIVTYAAPAYTPPQLPGFTAPVATIQNYLPPPPEDSGDGGGGDSGYSHPPAAPPSPVAQSFIDPFSTPGYLAALAAEQAGAQQADAAQQAYLERLIVRFGDPSLAQALGVTLNPLTAAAAQQNTQSGFSTLAQEQHARDLQQRGILNRLAAHGLQFSGDVGYGTLENERAYGARLYGAQQALLDQAANAQQQTVQAKQGLHQNVVSALMGGYQQAVQNPAFWAQPVDTGGQQAAANAATTQPAAQAPQSITSPIATGYSYANRPAAAPRAPTSRLAVTPMQNPYRYQVARNVRYG